MDLFLEMPEIGEINSLTLQSLQTHCNLFNFKEIGKIDGNCHQDDHALSWSFIQRMTRLASSQHKCWVIAFLSSSVISANVISYPSGTFFSKNISNTA